MQKSHSTICKGPKHSLGKGNMGTYIDCSKSSMASPSRALSEQRKIAKILKSVHDDNVRRESKERDLKPLPALIETDPPKTLPQPRGYHEGKGSDSSNLQCIIQQLDSSTRRMFTVNIQHIARKCRITSTKIPEWVFTTVWTCSRKCFSLYVSICSNF